MQWMQLLLIYQELISRPKLLLSAYYFQGWWVGDFSRWELELGVSLRAFRQFAELGLENQTWILRVWSFMKKLEESSQS